MSVLCSISAFRSLAFSSGLFVGIRQGIENNLLTEDRWKVMLDGLEQTVIVSLLSVLAATLAGALLCALRMSKGNPATFT